MSRLSPPPSLLDKLWVVALTFLVLGAVILMIVGNPKWMLYALSVGAMLGSRLAYHDQTRRKP